MKKLLLIKISLVVLVMLGFAFQLSAQPVRGMARIRGLVLDEAGNPIPNAKIMITGLEKEKFTMTETTDKKGEWKIIGLGSGHVKVEASATGFLPNSKVVEISQINLNPKIQLVLKRTAQPLGDDEESVRIFEEGSQFYEDGKYSDALLFFKLFLEQYPLAFQIHFNIGNCYKEMNQLDLAQVEYQTIIDKIKEEQSGESLKFQAKAVAAIGELYLRKDDLANAQKYFQQSLDLNPKDEILAYNVGEIFFSNAKMDESIKYFTLASEIKPDWPDAYLKLGYVHLNMTEYEKAKENFTKFLELAPDHPQAASVQGILDYLKK